MLRLIARSSTSAVRFIPSAPTTVRRSFATMTSDPSKYLLNHTMLRVKDPVRSIKFYEFLGMKQVNKMDYPENKFTLYFMGYPGACKDKHWTNCEALVEMTHNYGTEDDPNFKVATGNAEPGKGFGHLCVSVDNIQAACDRLEKEGYSFQKKLTDGRMRHIAFVKDPDGYWVEIIGQKELSETENVHETDTQTYKSNHSMIRVKDIAKSLDFYQNTMGMEKIRESKNPANEFDLYFLAYPKSPSAGPDQRQREAILELTYNYGTEKDPNFKYHDGNSEPQGFGHIAISVDDIEAACKRFEEKGVNWKKRLTDGRMKDIAFIFDPDGYWIEVIQNEKLKPRSKW